MQAGQGQKAWERGQILEPSRHTAKKDLGHEGEEPGTTPTVWKDQFPLSYDEGMFAEVCKGKCLGAGDQV